MKHKFLKVISIFLSIVLFLSFNTNLTCILAEDIHNNIIYGDVNNDNIIDCFDAISMREILVKQTSLKDNKSADLNGNNLVDANDLYLLHLYLLGAIKEFPIESLNRINTNNSEIIANKQPELSINKEMQSLAITLKDPINIYNYLCNNIKTEFYINSRKGAIGTFDMNGGNNVDCASLLIAMLNQIGIESVYVNGTISIPLETAKNLTGATNIESVLKILRFWDPNATSNADNSQIILKHTWVRSKIDGKIYDLDCSFKEYSYQDTFFDIFNSKYSVESEELNSSYINDIINNACRSQCGNYAINDKKIIKKDFSIIPETLPYTYVDSIEYNSIDISNSDTITFNLKGKKYTYTSAELYGKKISMQYEVNDLFTDEDIFLFSPSEGETIYDLIRDYANDGGLASAGKKYGDMQLVLRIDDEKIASGNPARITQIQTTIVQINTMGKEFELKKECTVGSTYSIVLDYQNMPSNKMINDIKTIQQLKDNLTESNLFSTTYMGELLNLIGDAYFAELDVCYNMLAEETNVFYTRNLGITFVGFEPTIITDEIDSQIANYNVDKSGNVIVDVLATSFNTVARDLNTKSESQFKHAAGIISSQLESSIIDQICNTQSVSTANVLRYSKKNNIDICMLSSLNSDELNSLEINENAKNIISNLINHGNIVTVPKKDITINSWTGCGYMVYDSTEGFLNYSLSRHVTTNGGYSSTSISLTSMIAVFFSTEALLSSAVFLANALTAISFAGVIPFIGTTLVATVALVLLVVSLEAQIYTFELVARAEAGDEDALQQLKTTNYIDIFLASVTTSAAVASKACNSFYKESRVIENSEKYGSNAVEGAMKNSDDIADTFRVAQELEDKGINKKNISSALVFGDDGIDIIINNKYYREIIQDTDNFTDYLNAAGEKIRITKQKSNTLLESINSKLNSTTEGTRIEAKVADFINNNTEKTVVQFGCDVKTPQNIPIGDIDVSTSEHLIEVKKSFKKVSYSQIKKYTDVFDKQFFNFENKKVIIYIDDPIVMNEYNKATIKQFNDNGVIIVNSLDELLEVLN